MTVKIPKAAQPLVDLKPKYDFFVGIDSDGCAFDTMEIKHKECFCPNIINYWGLQGVSKYANSVIARTGPTPGRSSQSPIIG